MKKVSIIIPIYNAEKYLKRCLDSVINQTYKNIEIICINDGSKDNSLNILKEYAKKDRRIIIIDNENKGVSSARNEGIKKSTGEYITFVDSDDWLEVDAVEILYNTILEKNVDVVRSNYYRNFEYEKNECIGNLFDLTNKIYNTKDKHFCTSVIDKLLDDTIQGYVWLLFTKRESVLKTSLFKEDIHLLEDIIFYIELFSKVDNIFFLDKPTYHYYCNVNSCTKSSKYYIRNMYNIIKVNKYMKEILIDSGFSDESVIRKMNTFHCNMIINYVFLLYRGMKNDKNSLKNELDKLINNKDVLNIIGESDLKQLPLHLRLPIYFIINKKYKTLFIFYKVRNTMSIIKDIITRRKE